VQEMDRSGPGGGHAHAHLARPLRVAAGHEGGHLLVPDLDQLWIPLRAVERAEQGVDPVSRVAVDPVDTPFPQTGEDEISNELGHNAPFSFDGSARLSFGYPWTTEANRVRPFVSYSELSEDLPEWRQTKHRCSPCRTS